MIISLPRFLKAQQINTLYFMEEVPMRHMLNPSFQPTTDYYLSLPVIGMTQFNAGNNSVSLKDAFYPVDGKTINYLDPQADPQNFYNELYQNTVLKVDFQTNLLSFGYRHKSDYWTFTVTEKMEGTVDLPKDLFRVTLFNTQKTQTNSFDFASLQGDISVYTESALGYSTQPNEKWIIGGKLKLLVGSANASNHIKQAKLDISPTEVLLRGYGTENYSGPFEVIPGLNSQSFTFKTPAGVGGWLKPAGLGAGFDAGCQYQWDDKITLSASLLDIGFIHWTSNALNYKTTAKYNFIGINVFNNNSTVYSFQDIYNQLIGGNTLSDSISKALRKTLNSVYSTNSYTTATTGKVNLGVEYSLLKDKLSLGVLSYSQLFRSIVTEEITLSANSHPYHWLDASLSYSLVNGRFSTLGAGVGIRTGIFEWFAAADYIPLQTKTLTLQEMGIHNTGINIGIPYNSKYFNLSAGMNIVFNKSENRKNRGLVRSRKRNDCNCEPN